MFSFLYSTKDRTPIARDSSDGPPAYNSLFPGIKDVRNQVGRARQQNPEGRSENVAVPLTLFDIICKSCKFNVLLLKSATQHKDINVYQKM